MSSNDYWTLDLDRLGMDAAGEGLARLILTCQPPYAVCVQGKWGSGKTSLMRYAMARVGGEPLGTTVKTVKTPAKELPKLLEGSWGRLADGADSFIEAILKSQLPVDGHRKLRQRTSIVPIWFNPWQQQDLEMPVVALLQELRGQFNYLVQFGRFAGKLSQIAVEAGVTILGELLDAFAAFQGGPKLGLGKSFENIRKVGEEYEKRNFEALHDAQRLNLLFEGAVRRLLGPGELTDDEESFPQGKDGDSVALRRLVVFVDDLDRCSQQQTVKLLESIKLYLQTRYCVFVFGMDGAAARRAVCTVLPHKSPEEGQEYLEKLFQATVHVPVPATSMAFIEGLLRSKGLELNGTPVTDAAQSIARLVEPNPRKLKNFVNTVAVGWEIETKRAGGPVGFPLFLLLAFLRAYHPDVFRLLAYQPGSALYLNNVLTEGAAQFPPHASPLHHFFHRAFRHAFTDAFPDLHVPTRKDSDEVVEEIIARLDRHRGDSAFLLLWKEEFGSRTEEEMVRAVERAVCSPVASEPAPNHGS